MHQGNWKCSSCGGAITELPFIPRSEAGLTCRACYSAQKGVPGTAAGSSMPTATDMPDIPFEAGLAGEPDLDDGLVPLASNPADRPKISGDWQCATCGGPITSLPFIPRDTSNLKCLDCFKRSKA